MLGFTSGFLAIPGLLLVGKRVCNAVLPSRVSVVWLGRCEPPPPPPRLSSASADSSWSWENCKGNWNKRGKGMGSEPGLQVPGFASLVWDNRSRSVAATCSGSEQLRRVAGCSLPAAWLVTWERFPTVSESHSRFGCESEAHPLPPQPMFGFPVVGFYRAVLYWIYHASC